MTQSPFEQMITHLEFLGYEVERREDVIVARHSTHINLLMRELRSGLLFRSLFGANDTAKGDKASYLDFINSLNRASVVFRFYADEDLDLIIEAWYPNFYDRTKFGAFVDAMNTDFRSLNDLDKYLE